MSEVKLKWVIRDGEKVLRMLVKMPKPVTMSGHFTIPKNELQNWLYEYIWVDVPVEDDSGVRL